MRTTSKIPVWHQLFTAVLLVIIGMILLTLPSVNMNPLMNSTQSGKTIFFISLMMGAGSILLLRMVFCSNTRSIKISVPDLALFFWALYLVVSSWTRAVSEYVVYTALDDSYKALKETGKAEQAYLHAWHMNPSRFYPKYLLAKLYDESGQKEKAVTTAKELLEKQVKIESIAIEEIRAEMEKIISENKTDLPH